MTRSRWTALALLAATLGLFPGCGGGGGVKSNATPIVSTVFPAIITAGSQGFTLFIAGTNFQSDSTGASFAFWNGIPLSTFFNTTTAQLQASVPASFVVNPNVVQITVMNPAPGGGVSNAVSFTIEPVVNSNPFISSISPSMIASGSAAFTLTVNGGNFSTPSPCSILCIDSGSTMGVSPFVADEDFSGGTTVNQANAINTSEVTNPAPVAVYQTARVAVANAGGPGTTFSYTIGGFTANSSHLLRLHFCETFFTAAGSRVFNVSINGVQLLTDFDIFAAAGGENIANIQQFTEAANASGQYVITFVSVTNNALISGIEIDSTTNDVVTWNGQFRTTTFVSSSKLTAQILNTDVASPGMASVTVLDTLSGIIEAPSVSFTITGAANPTPSISSLSPSTALTGGPDFELLIKGSNFVSNSIACFNGGPLATAFISASQLGAWIPAADIAVGGVAAISVTNSGFCGVNPASTSLNLSINNPLPTIATLSPSTITAGGQNFTLVVSGSNFIVPPNGITFAFWNGSLRSTIYNPNTQQLNVLILASDVATAGTAQVTVENPAPGGGTSAPSSFTIVAPQVGGPVISSLVPSNTVAGNPSFTLTVNGSNFVSTDVITWNAQPQVTAFFSASKLTTQINGALIASPGFGSVAVMPTSGASSPVVDFTITGPSNLAPMLAITSPVSPVSANAGGPAFELVINGSNFSQTSSVMWNATSLVTSFVNSNQLVAWVPASLITASGNVNITVFNPAPGGGTSQIFVFAIH